MVAADVTNDSIADDFEEVAALLEAQNANPFRVRAWRKAAETLRSLQRPVQLLLAAEGVEGLRRLPGIGTSLANAVSQLVTTGHLPLLERLHGDLTAEKLFASVPGIGPEIAARIHEELDIETLGELQAAAIDGRLARVPGVGPGRVQAVRDALASRFRMPPRQAVEQKRSRATDESVPVAELLDIDAEYRRKAEADQLFRIAPRRFNPTHEAWLPILHTARAGRHFTALFSNTARAHELGTTHDWVVIYRDDGDGHGQWTVVTSLFGGLKGRRIVRGRETECRAHYETLESDEGDQASSSARTNSPSRSSHPAYSTVSRTGQ